MADFKRLRERAAAARPTNPREIFDRLPKPPGMNDLWEGQAALLHEWQERRTERNLILKLNTGGGKTLAGLLIGQSLLNDLRQPVVYLCPTNQLVEQTLEKARQVQLAALQYERGGLPRDFLNADAVLVANYHVIFNGRSVFGVRDGREVLGLGGVICDDAHAAFGTLREQFSIDIDRVEQRELYQDLVTRFRPAIDSVGWSGRLEEVLSRRDDIIVEVPYWAWQEQHAAVERLLIRNHADAFRFNLPLIRGSFHTCHVLIRRDSITITPFLPLVDRIPAFADCRRRIFMSATLADDSSVVRTFAVPASAAEQPIAPPSLAGVGERMILVPALTGIDPTAVLPMAKRIASDLAAEVGVVVLTPSEAIAQGWADVGDIVIGHEQVTAAIERLTQGGANRPVILVNRYDGIDLVGNACRLLILDGLPTGTNSYETYRAEVMSGGTQNLVTAQRIEQGLGRGARGSGDHCAVLLLGRDLVSWIGRRDGLSLMTPPTRVQIELGQEISETLTSEEDLRGTLLQSVRRDPDWTQYHAEQLAVAAEAGESAGRLEMSRMSLTLAASERRYLESFDAMNYDRALAEALEVGEGHHRDRYVGGWFLQAAARAARFANDTRTEDLQRRAHQANRRLLRTPSRPAYNTAPDIGEQAEKLAHLVERYRVRAGLIVAFEKDTAALLLPDSSANQFEEAIRHLGRYLGFSSTRPENEYDIGPDNLWLPERDVGFVIECKHRRENPDKPLPERDHHQLLGAVDWFQEQYPERRPIRVIVHPNNLADPNAGASQTEALTLSSLERLVDEARQLLADFRETAVTGVDLVAYAAERITQRGLTPDGIGDRFLMKFKAAA